MIEVDALPSHRHLDDTVQLAQGERAGDQHSPPHHWADAEQPNLDLHDRFRIGGGQGSSVAGSGSLRGWCHPPSLSLIAHPDASTPQILMLSYRTVQMTLSDRFRDAKWSHEMTGLRRKAAVPSVG